MSAEEYLNDQLKGCYQTFDEDGITLIIGIEHSEVCEIMESYHKHQMSKELEEAEKEISTIHIGKGTHVFYGDGITDGAKWMLNHLKKKIG